jgi:aldehyde:ferredoxin oxidoreductase
LLKERHSQEHQIVAIGPAGENRVRFASIIHRLNNAVGNAGFGGVMGAKGLKAIAVRGTGGVALAAPQAFTRALADVWRLARGGLGAVGRPDAGYPTVACTHGCSVKCWTRVRPLEDRYGSGSGLRMTTCNEGVWAGGIGRSYKATSARGQSLCVPAVAGLGPLGMDVSNLVEDMGFTTWAFHTFGSYFTTLRSLGIDQLLGEPLDVENPEWWRDWVMNVSHRRGSGDAYAEGLARFYDTHPVGPRHLVDFLEDTGSRGHGWHRDGRTMEAHPSPFWEHAALLYAVSTRDATPSTHGFFFLDGVSRGVADEGFAELLQKLAERVYGAREAILPGDEHVEHVTIWHQHRSVIKDSLGVCDWVFPILRRTYGSREEMLAERESIYGDTSAEARLYRACTGIDLGIKEMESPVAERIVNLERAVDIRNYGRCRQADEAVIPHFQWPEKTDNTHLSADAAEFRALLDRFYDLRGWDKETGWPTRQRLLELGLTEVAQELQSSIASAELDTSSK